MVSPLSLGSRGTSEKVIFEDDHSDHFLEIEGILKSYIPRSLSIEISTKVDEVVKVGGLEDWRIGVFSGGGLRPISLHNLFEFYRRFSDIVLFL